ncbi:hypothetical protein AB834_06900 [PVC group bacterium (ex Bugula neritina AB1)]|nr:hypothetical protein AB834_06900 [PVC group bacterium (ex Bugula neritina AB1)]
MSFLVPKSLIRIKQIIAVTGLFLIFFVVAHLAGNLTFFAGADVFNGYAKKLQNMRPFLNFFEFVLFLIFIFHMYLTVFLIIRKRKVRPVKYSVQKSSAQRSFSSRLMTLTGPIIFIYIVLHLLDYTFSSHEGQATVVNGKSLGLYGLVFNSFSSLRHSLWYIFSMVAVGLHLDHGFQSFFQTFGIYSSKYGGFLKKFSRIFSICITLSYVTIPIYAYFLNHYGNDQVIKVGVLDESKL